MARGRHLLERLAVALVGLRQREALLEQQVAMRVRRLGLLDNLAARGSASGRAAGILGHIHIHEFLALGVQSAVGPPATRRR